MKKILFVLVGFVLMSCDAKHSNVTKKVEKQVIDSLSAAAVVDTMTTEEADVAKKVGAVKAVKLASDTFKVVKLVAPEVYKELLEWEYPLDVQDSMPLTGVVSARGRWYVPLQYCDVSQLAKDVFVGHLYVNMYDYELEAPAYTELYQVVYRGKPVGRFSYRCEISPIHYRNKIAGFMKTFYNAERQCYWHYFIDTSGRGWDTEVDIQVGSRPHFEKYQIKNGVLTLWGGAEKPEELQAFFPEDRSLYRVDLGSGRVLENPFVPTD